MILNQDAAEAIKTISEPLGISIYEAAYSIYTVSNETMINAIKDITVSEGIDQSGCNCCRRRGCWFRNNTYC